MPLDLKPRWRLPSDLGYGPDIPPDRYVLGDIWITRHREGPCVEYITVNEDASSHILIGDELLRDLKFDSRRYNACAWLDLKDPEYPQHVKSECPSCELIEWAYAASTKAAYCFTGTVLHINARNRELIYRIGKYRARSTTWEASWPD